ncbi:MAG: hypothetical protein H0W23_02070 [Chloroflexia bacterium]|nr:hypothetical protein [Chloroflexia bacterium]
MIAHLGDDDTRTHTVPEQAIEGREDEWHNLSDLINATWLQVRLLEQPDGSRVVVVCDTQPHPDDFASTLEYAWNLDTPEASAWSAFRDLPAIDASPLLPSIEERAVTAIEDIAFYASTLKPSDVIAHIDNDDLITELEPVPEWLEDIASELSRRMVQNTSPEIREHLPASAIAHLLRNRPSEETEG